HPQEEAEEAEDRADAQQAPDGPAHPAAPGLRGQVLLVQPQAVPHGVESRRVDAMRGVHASRNPSRSCGCALAAELISNRSIRPCPSIPATRFCGNTSRAVLWAVASLLYSRRAACRRSSASLIDRWRISTVLSDSIAG